MKTTPRPSPWIRKEPWHIRNKPSDRVIMVGTVLLVLACMLPTAGCAIQKVTMAPASGGIALTYSEDEYIRPHGHRRAEEQLAGAADGACPRGWQQIKRTTATAGDGAYNHTLIIKCDGGDVGR